MNGGEPIVTAVPEQTHLSNRLSHLHRTRVFPRRRILAVLSFAHSTVLPSFSYQFDPFLPATIKRTYRRIMNYTVSALFGTLVVVVVEFFKFTKFCSVYKIHNSPRTELAAPCREQYNVALEHYKFIKALDDVGDLHGKKSTFFFLRSVNLSVSRAVSLGNYVPCVVEILHATKQ